MSILIKGMEMPKSCPCEIIGVGYDLFCSFAYGVPERVREYYECCEKETRPDWCPLEEVSTPHGRLIDADALLKDFPIRADHYDKEHGSGHFIYGVETVMDYVSGMPTIIEAEE